MNTPNFPFVPADKTPRLNRNVYITEKLDGSRATIFIDDSGELFCGSRQRWITPENDNFGFARWAEGNREDLLKLGPGRHDGEWFGQGIQRNYGLKERRFALFNVGRWFPLENNQLAVFPKDGTFNGRPGVFQLIPHPEANPTICDLDPLQVQGPACCFVVPVIWRGNFDIFDYRACLEILRTHGSFAAPGFRNPEGIVIFHEASKKNFKVTLVGDESPKGFIAGT